MCPVQGSSHNLDRHTLYTPWHSTLSWTKRAHHSQECYHHLNLTSCAPKKKRTWYTQLLPRTWTTYTHHLQNLTWRIYHLLPTRFHREWYAKPFNNLYNNYLHDSRRLCVHSPGIPQEYLSSLGVLHRDLACRNILVDEGKLLKISDFGLSRDTPEYVSSLQDKMPLRWMALETLTKNIFTEKSDV